MAPATTQALTASFPREGDTATPEGDGKAEHVSSSTGTSSAMSLDLHFLAKAFDTDGCVGIFQFYTMRMSCFLSTFPSQLDPNRDRDCFTLPISTRWLLLLYVTRPQSYT